MAPIVMIDFFLAGLHCIPSLHYCIFIHQISFSLEKYRHCFHVSCRFPWAHFIFPLFSMHASLFTVCISICVSVFFRPPPPVPFFVAIRFLYPFTSSIFTDASSYLSFLILRDFLNPYIVDFRNSLAHGGFARYFSMSRPKLYWCLVARNF